MLEYRGYDITLNPKRVRSRAFDWDFVHQDWFGPDDPRCGCCECVDDAAELIDWIEDGLMRRARSDSRVTSENAHRK